MSDVSEGEDGPQYECAHVGEEKKTRGPCSLSVANIKSPTGLSMAVLSKTAPEWGVPFEPMIIATCFPHMNMAFEQLSILLVGFGVVPRETSLRRMFRKVVASAPAEGFHKC